MLKQLFSVLILFTFLCVLYLVVLLFHIKSNDATFLIKKYHESGGNDTLPWMIKNLVQDQLEKVREALRGSQEKTQMPPNTNKTLELCPDIPPNLVGPLRVDFDLRRTLDEVRMIVGRSLKEGGKYKPEDCISQQKVAIVIPFRNQHEHLKHWLFYLHPILMRQQLDYGVYVINQDGEGTFNRAKLMNVGFTEALKEYDYDCFVFSDIDLVPMDDRNLYRCFDNPRHLSVAIDKFGFQLPYNSNFGGVSSLSKNQFLNVNGFSNTYWGWGGDVDDLYKRVNISGMSISRPDLLIGKMIKHGSDTHNEANPENSEKLDKTMWTMDIDGLNFLNYTVKNTVKDVLYTFITVDIHAPQS